MRAIEGSRRVGDRCLSRCPWLKLREKRLRVAGETGAPTHHQGCFLGALCSGRAPSDPHPSSLTLVPPSSPDLREKLDPLVLRELLVLEVPR